MRYDTLADRLRALRRGDDYVVTFDRRFISDLADLLDGVADAFSFGSNRKGHPPSHSDLDEQFTALRDRLPKP